MVTSKTDNKETQDRRQDRAVSAPRRWRVNLNNLINEALRRRRPIKSALADSATGFWEKSADTLTPKINCRLIE